MKAELAEVPPHSSSQPIENTFKKKKESDPTSTAQKVTFSGVGGFFFWEVEGARGLLQGEGLGVRDLDEETRIGGWGVSDSPPSPRVIEKIT